MYLFEHLLMRLGKSGYAEAFVLKGGLLISSMTGVAQRTTMDTDTTVIGMDMGEDTVSEAVAAICAVDVADGMEYTFERIEPIREGDEYANWRAHLRVRYGKIDAPVKIDITTGDEIVPGRIEYRYPLMFEEGSVRVLSYPLETVLAEKLETVVSRGIANTRGRDYYDIHALLRLKADEINRDSLHEAVVATASRRGSLGKMGDYEAVLGEVRRSDMMRGIWSSYASASPPPMRKASISKRRSIRPSSSQGFRSLTIWTDGGEKSLTAPIPDDCAIGISPTLRITPFQATRYES